MIVALCDCVGWDVALLEAKDRGRLSNVKRKLQAGNYSPEDVLRLKTYWYSTDWRGKQGQAPSPEDVLREVKKPKDRDARLAAIRDVAKAAGRRY